MFEIRPAREEDRSAILQLWHRGWHDAHAYLVPAEILPFRTPEYFALWLNQAAEHFYVAVHGAVLGFVSTKGEEVVKLYVDTEARGTGVAGGLLAHAEQLLSGEGVTEAKLHCTAGNIRAQRFYEREGWTLSRTFEDALWLPIGIPGRFTVETHCYHKFLTPPRNEIGNAVASFEASRRPLTAPRSVRGSGSRPKA
ncbi:GNAT family N-acetyltransferase [Ensifer aridi]|uniref:GNAT family N-acetyltransferase n=1 Tax=Ensifer aridi TaxID=1708715 RepID=UPI000A10B6D8|nr:GNAT family N-acetyltransferase [Ensifer aridi]